MAKTIIKALKGPGFLLEDFFGGDGADKPASRPAPASREDAADAGADARREARRRRRGRSSTILAGSNGSSPTRKSVLGGG